MWEKKKHLNNLVSFSLLNPAFLHLGVITQIGRIGKVNVEMKLLAVAVLGEVEQALDLCAIATRVTYTTVWFGPPLFYTLLIAGNS